jgi:hypothetical protein
LVFALSASSNARVDKAHPHHSGPSST